MKCPVCVTKDLMMAERQGIEIDYCPDCRGVWLDRGELDKIIERSAATDVPRPSVAGPRYSAGDNDWGHSNHHKGDRGHYDGKHTEYRKKSFWQEIFD